MFINGEKPGKWAAQNRKHIGTVSVIVDVPGVGQIVIAEYEVPGMGTLQGIRTKTLLCERCFRWVGNHYWITPDDCFAFIVKRISSNELHILELQVNGDHTLYPISQYYQARSDAIDPKIAKIIADARRFETAHSCAY